jgi:hypothetical protein
MDVDPDTAIMAPRTQMFRNPHCLSFVPDGPNIRIEDAEIHSRTPWCEQDGTEFYTNPGNSARPDRQKSNRSHRVDRRRSFRSQFHEPEHAHAGDTRQTEGSVEQASRDKARGLKRGEKTISARNRDRDERNG